MDKILKDVLNYEKIIIVSNEEDEILSKMIFKSIENAIHKNSLKYNSDLNLVGEYKVNDLFHKDVSNYSLKKYYNKNNNYLIRFKGNGFNINFMGLIKSQQMARDAHLYLAVARNICVVLHDRMHDYVRRECDLSSLYRSYKIKQLLNNINE